MARVLLLLPTTTYRTAAFIEAARRLGIDIVAASEEPNALATGNPSGLVTIDFLDPENAGRSVRELAGRFPIDAVIPVDEDTAVAAAAVSGELHIRSNSLEAAITAKNKLIMREALKRAGVRVPWFRHFTLDDDPARIAVELEYPCVIKPVFLSTSRGVMRVDQEEEVGEALRRLEAILSNPQIARKGGEHAREVLAEEFIPGFEVALEGLLTGGNLQVLAIFDKPDPLNGPFFEETIYVTPSRLPVEVQEDIVRTTGAGARAMGLSNGPVHAELRINEAGAWIVEVAARSIGGLCSRTLKFGQGISLEELVIRHAIGEDVSSVERDPRAAGVMMIPIPRAGILHEVIGVESARQVPDIEDVIITAHVTQRIEPPPEGSSYLGFIFSRAASPERAEAALREAHRRLEFLID